MAATVDRAAALQRLRARLRDELVVAALGNPAYDLFNAGDRPQHFYMWGAMGLAPSVALGVALTAPEATVIALEGDGGLLMNLGSLATIGATAPANLVLVVFDNAAWDLTGGQPTATASSTDLAAVAHGCGIAQTRRVATLDDFDAAMAEALSAPGPWCVVVDTAPTQRDRVKPLVALRRRFVAVDDFIDAAVASAESAT